MSTQAFYDKFIREWSSHIKPDLKIYKRVLLSVSETTDGKNWAYLSNTFLDEKEARKTAQFESKITNGLWRVAVGNHTTALYLNGEEIKEE